MRDQETGWDFVNEEQKQRMLEQVTKENCGEKLALVREVSVISRRELARRLGVSESTLRRLETKESDPTDKFMNRLRALCLIGHAKFDKMSEAERERISETLGAGGGVISGIGGAIGAVAASGSVAGLSAAGMTSGLAALGAGSMLAGIGVVAAIPVAAGLAGYGLVKAIKKLCEANNLSSEERNECWEIRRDPGKAQ